MDFTEVKVEGMSINCCLPVSFYKKYLNQLLIKKNTIKSYLRAIKSYLRANIIFINMGNLKFINNVLKVVILLIY